MKLLQNHKKRVEKVKAFTGKNKVFVITMLAAIIFLLVNFVFVSNKSTKVPEDNNTAIVTEAEQPAAETEPLQWRPEPDWRFYFIDLIILGVGSGLCLIMILRERKKTKEELK